jgi:hypothetical protein
MLFTSLILPRWERAAWPPVPGAGMQSSSHGCSVEILQRLGRAPGATRATSGNMFRRRSVLDPHAFPTRVPERRSAERGSPRRPAFPGTRLRTARTTSAHVRWWSAMALRTLCGRLAMSCSRLALMRVHVRFM